MRLMLSFYRAYPWQTFFTLLALSVAGLAEGVGLSVLLPLLNMAMEGQGQAAPASDNEFSQSVRGALDVLGITPTLGNMLLVVVFAIGGKSLLLLFAKRQVGYTAARLATDLRLELLRAIMRSRWEYFLGQPVGKLTNSLATEAARASESFVNGATALTFLAQAVVYGAVAIAVSWRATLTGIVAGAVIIGLSHSLVRITKKAGRKQTSVLLSLMATMTDTLGSVKPLKGMGREHLADAVLSMETTRLNRALERQALGSALLESTQEFLFALVIAGGIYVALAEFAMPFATVMVLVVVVGQMVALLGKVQKQYQKMTLSESAYWSMKRTIAEAQAEEEELRGGERPVLATRLCMEGVCFAYDERRVLDDLSLEIPAGQLVTLIGPSGAGKTTVVDLLIGLIRPDAGRITLDGTPLDSMDIKQWRRSIGYVPQETLLLHESIAHNVSLGDRELSQADIEHALRAAGAWDFVSALPEGMHSSVGERGGRLSGGQRQRIVIARALVRRPQLLILDEATSALDAESAEAVRQTLERLRGSLTILTITHESGLVDIADRVYRLESGRAVRQSP
ncbi:MAG: ABC transporter ATP-binding protein [Gammaproteobacteria bacterium]|nr:ABC transporter ATP-binding protein [Gammaproteobacteria bacterium]MBP6482412.1 ABC transporter ATP-binding protein [Pseudomonadales bacterium]MBP7912033.1 ABC transporter ATP-binding protein [Pseudomonadales bacterium]